MYKLIDIINVVIESAFCVFLIYILFVKGGMMGIIEITILWFQLYRSIKQIKVEVSTLNSVSKPND